jgi:hypothetical protein
MAPLRSFAGARTPAAAAAAAASAGVPAETAPAPEDGPAPPQQSPLAGIDLNGAAPVSEISPEDTAELRKPEAETESETADKPRDAEQ